MSQPLARITETARIVKMDVKNKKIIVMLAENSRLPASVIAKKVHVSRDAVAYRIQKLQNNEVIAGFLPLVDLTQFGYYTYHVFLLLKYSHLHLQ